MNNDITCRRGRFCNHIIRAHAASAISKKGNLLFNYGQYFEQMKELGIWLHTTGSNFFPTLHLLSDENFMYYINYMSIDFNIDISYCYCQTKEFATYLYNLYALPERREGIIAANKYKERYGTNNDLFVHCRLGDVEHLNQGYDYYDRVIGAIQFSNGYIASDSIDHDICQRLIAKYNLKPIILDEVCTIQFGSTCRHILLTGGTFSFVIGLFGFFSQVYYLKTTSTWFPVEIYELPGWTEV